MVSYLCLLKVVPNSMKHTLDLISSWWYFGLLPSCPLSTVSSWPLIWRRWWKSRCFSNVSLLSNFLKIIICFLPDLIPDHQDTSEDIPTEFVLPGLPLLSKKLFSGGTISGANPWWQAVCWVNQLCNRQSRRNWSLWQVSGQQVQGC